MFAGVTMRQENVFCFEYDSLGMSIVVVIFIGLRLSNVVP